MKTEEVNEPLQEAPADPVEDEVDEDLDNVSRRAQTGRRMPPQARRKRSMMRMTMTAICGTIGTMMTAPMQTMGLTRRNPNRNPMPPQRNRKPIPPLLTSRKPLLLRMPTRN